ncbi:MAG: ParB/RepB/Spo0J family partition protein [Acidobacteria bacterium]|nr:ParB/RepB/Spo0J family partition protein [Acidobacteriota bacterium]
MARKVLGRGLKALLPEAPQIHAGFALIDINRLVANPRQPRTRFETEALEGLAASILEHGVLQPLLVSEDGPGRYMIVAGERRWRAAKKAGLDRIPVVIREKVDGQLELELALVENLQRRDLTPLEEARAYEQLGADRGLSQSQIAERVGIDRSTVSNSLRLLKLPERIRFLVEEGRLSAGHGRALLAFAAENEMETWADRVVAEGLSVRVLERAAAKVREEEKKPIRRNRPTKSKDPNIMSAEKKLTLKLGSQVEIIKNKKGGRIVVSCSSHDELLHVFDLLIGDG